MAGLHWDVDEGEDSRMVEEVSNRAELVEHVGRIGHADLRKEFGTLIMMRLWLLSYSQREISNSEILVLRSRP